MSRSVCLAIICLIFASYSLAFADGPKLEAIKVAQPPNIDGELSEQIWKQPIIASGFTKQTRPPTEDTKVWAVYDSSCLYFAFECADSSPTQIRSQQKKRNGDMFRDDWVCVGVDTLGDRRTHYWFHVNPAGTQMEEIPGGAATKVEWRGDWQAAAKTGERGWTAEIAIPFAILKYPPSQKKFGLIFRRNLSRVMEESSWPSGADYYAHENQATFSGVQAPRQRAVPRFMPYALIGAGGDLKNRIGMDVKYVAPNNITGLLAIRPDFQTIEDVVDTIDFSYNARFLPDRRPFFTEGGEFFDDRNMFHSRRVGEIDGGLKTFGKVGRFAFGALGTTHPGSDHNMLFNTTYDTSRHSDIGISALQHYGTDGPNRVLKFNANWQRPTKIYGYYWGFSLYDSLNEAGSSQATRAYINRWNGPGNLGWHVQYERIPDDYDPALAFVPERNKESVFGWVDFQRDYKKGPILNWIISSQYSYATHVNRGGLFYRGVTPGVFVNFRKGWALGADYTVNDRPPNIDLIPSITLGLKVNDLYRATRLSIRNGKQNGGNYRFISLSQGIKLTDQFSMHLAAERLSLIYAAERASETERATQLILSGVYDMTAERSVVFRLVGNQSGTNGYAAYRQELRRGMDIFFIVGDPNATKFRPRIGLKLVRTF